MYLDQLKSIGFEAAVEDVKNRITHFDAGQALALVDEAAVAIKKLIADLKEMWFKLTDEDTKFFVMEKIRLLTDFLQWPYNMVRETLGI